MRTSIRSTVVAGLAGLVIGVGTDGFASVDSPTAEIITLADVVKKVSTDNYLVLENAQRVYQAKESIAVARGNLLPSLNLWKIISMPLTIVGGLGAVEDIAPFLVPANWMRVEEQKLLHQAQKESYRALWANEVMTAKTLYMHLMLDVALLGQVEASRTTLKAVLELVMARERFGTVPPGTSRGVEARLLAIEEDVRALTVLISEEKSLLSYLMGFPSTVELVLMPIPMPDFEGLKPLDYREYEASVVSASPELQQYDQLLKVADLVKREIYFSFLGVSTMSRGAGGGVFDGLPVSKGLGFGTGGSIRIAKAQKEIIRTQRRGSEETLKRSLNLLVETYNLDLVSYRNVKRREYLTRSIITDLQARLRFGEAVDAEDLIRASEAHIEAETALAGVKLRVVTAEDKLSRMLLRGDYSKEIQ